jgi:hypothetical protein
MGPPPSEAEHLNIRVLPQFSTILLSPFGDRYIRSIWSGCLFDSTPTTGRRERIIRGSTYASAGGDPQCTDSSIHLEYIAYGINI